MQARIWTLIVPLLAAAVLAPTFGACASSDDICDEACEIWDSCTQVEGNTVNYSYDECYDECKAEGDWTRGYLRCLRRQDTCPALGNQC